MIKLRWQERRKKEKEVEKKYDKNNPRYISNHNCNLIKCICLDTRDQHTKFLKFSHRLFIRNTQYNSLTHSFIMLRAYLSNQRTGKNPCLCRAYITEVGETGG